MYEADVYQYKYNFACYKFWSTVVEPLIETYLNLGKVFCQQEKKK